MGGFLAAATAYILAHVIFPVDATKWSADQLVELDYAGRVRRISERDLQWYVGRDDTAKLITEFTTRSQKIEDLEDRVIRQTLAEFQVRFSGWGQPPEDFKSLALVAGNGNFGYAAKQFATLVQGWSEETRRFVGEKWLMDLNYGLRELAQLSAAQFQTRRHSLEPPLMHQIFWMSPGGALAEAVCWSIFGTMVNLLLNVAQAHAEGRFKSDEIWVSVAKLVYGPALSFALILVVYFGVLDVGMETRFWFLPLAGFLFGYNVRKIAAVIDLLSAKLLGNAAASVARLGAPEAQAAGYAAKAASAQARPRSLSELKQLAPIVAHTATVAAVINERRTS